MIINNRILQLAAIATLPVASIFAAGSLPGFNAETPYLIYYGSWNSTRIQQARDNYKLVVLEPSSNITRPDIQTIQNGPDATASTADDVLVLGYISLGEDARPGVPFTGDGSGPRVDPRPDPANDPLSTIVDLGLELGNPSPGGAGFASYYLDSDDDGTPDSNLVFGGFFVNAGDPGWINVITNMTRTVEGLSGLNEILTTTAGDGLGMDGIFVDTVDTAAPGDYEWTAASYEIALADIRTLFPDSLIFLNRALFYFSPTFEHYEYNPRTSINAVLFESYYTDSDDSNDISPFFDSNKHFFAPKLNVEASLSDGFTMFALGYDNPGTLTSTIQNQDYVESHAEQGWPLYRSIISLNQIRTDADTWNAGNPDSTPPVWDSTTAFSADSDSTVSGNQPPVPRTGIQAVTAADGELTVYWDVARDQTGPVKYNLYYEQGDSLDFLTATKLSAVQPELTGLYQSRIGSSSFPFEYTVSGLSNHTTYTLALRAEDSTFALNEETNTVTLSAIPVDTGYFKAISINGDFSDWDDIPTRSIDAYGDENGGLNDFVSLKIANDNDSVYFLIKSATGSTLFSNARNSVFIDTDDDFDSGFFNSGGLGSEFLLQGGNGFEQRDGSFAGPGIPTLSITSASSLDGLLTEFSVSRSALYQNGDSVFNDSDFSILFTSDQADFSSGEIFPILGVNYQIATQSHIDAWLVLE